MTQIGARLKSERIRLNLTQRRLADIGGIQANAQGKYENGDRCPRADYLAKISSVGIDVLYVITGHYTPPLNPSKSTTLSSIDDFRARVSVLSDALEILVSDQRQAKRASKH
ncbi:helix-turn-helix transcriptional regulator [Pseudomonas sp. 10C3]|uniref:helix-turn-helix domain-containing protein n=1 Tax=Pseudomonas sp. 10C3 TaxID=3118753 RepID=UPI002E810A56|nr:helix-turn-helix transcriptional regulator [Pseudomonas sp. 10C3]MEE3507781.1 helix-turn-helix transcriptional regulator [Pseudomonas sp. 10C3]